MERRILLIFSNYYLNILKKPRYGFFVERFDLQNSNLILFKKRIKDYETQYYDEKIGIVAKMRYKNEVGGILSVFTNVVGDAFGAVRFDNNIDLDFEFRSFCNWAKGDGAKLMFNGRMNNYELS